MLKNPFTQLWIACLIGTWALIPYILFLNVIPSPVSLPQVILLFTAQAAVLYGIVLYLSSLVLPKTDLHPFSTDNFVKGIAFPGILGGVAVGLFLVAANKTLFANSLFNSAEGPSFWKGAIASLYGGINEEVLLRLFFFALIYFALGKMFHFSSSKRNLFLWMANIIAALGFGLGHLPAAMKIAPLNTFEVARILLLNGVPGLLFGYLFWTRGFLGAAIAHFVADLMIHVFFA